VKLVVYADESGTHDNTGSEKGSREAVVAGIVAWYDEWARFCQDWQATLDRYEAPYFHFKEWSAASAIVRNKRKPFAQFANNPYCEWDLARLDGFLIELAKIAGSGKKAIVGGYVDTAKFLKRKLKGEVLLGEDPYKSCVTEFFERFVGQVQIHWPDFTEPVSFFFDQTDDPRWRHAILDVFYSHRKQEPRFAEIAFADKKRPPHLPLQAADMVAYRMRQIVGKFIDQSMSDLPDKMPELDKALFKNMFDCFESHKEEILLAYLSGKLKP
jgi:hypothetical protein